MYVQRKNLREEGILGIMDDGATMSVGQVIHLLHYLLVRLIVHDYFMCVTIF